MPLSLCEELYSLRESRAHLCTTIGSAVCKQTHALGGPQTPTHFVRSQKKGTDYSVLLLASSRFTLRFRQGLCKSALPTLDNALAYIVSILCMCSKNRVIDCNIVFICQLVFILEIIQQIGILQKIEFTNHF